MSEGKRSGCCHSRWHSSPSDSVCPAVLILFKFLSFTEGKVFLKTYKQDWGLGPLKTLKKIIYSMLYKLALVSWSQLYQVILVFLPESPLQVSYWYTVSPLSYLSVLVLLVQLEWIGKDTFIFLAFHYGIFIYWSENNLIYWYQIWYVIWYVLICK